MRAGRVVLKIMREKLPEEHWNSVNRYFPCDKSSHGMAEVSVQFDFFFLRQPWRVVDIRKQEC